MVMKGQKQYGFLTIQSEKLNYIQALDRVLKSNENLAPDQKKNYMLIL